MTELLKVSRNTVSRVFKAAAEITIAREMVDELIEVEIHMKLCPEQSHQPRLDMIDNEHVHRELLKLFLEEYVDLCRNWN